MKIKVTQTMDGGEGSEGMFYEEEKVLEACQIVGCDGEQIDSCINNMKEGREVDCINCYMSLCLDLEEQPTYESELRQEVSDECSRPNST